MNAGLPYLVRFDSRPMSSHADLAGALSACDDMATTHGMPLDRVDIIDRRPGKAWNRTTVTREACAIVGAFADDIDAAGREQISRYQQSSHA